MGASHRASLLLRRRRSDPRPRSRAQSSGLPHASHRWQQISQINGVAVPPNPVAAFFTPDMQINVSGAVAVNIAASNIPMGTAVTLRLSSEIGGDTLVNCNPLVGASVASTTATCTATFPFSVTITSARATW